MIPKEETPTGRTISGILSSQEDLQRYLATRAYYHLPFEGNLTIELFDFENYDYIFSEGCSIIQMQKLLWDQCSSYDNTGLMPVLIIRGEHISHKIYIYKIKPKNKYRVECGQYHLITTMSQLDSPADQQTIRNGYMFNMQRK